MPSLCYAEVERVVTLTLHRPQQGNSLNEGLITALLHHLSVMENHRTARLLVLRGAESMFCQGLDPAQLARWRAQTRAEVTAALAPLAALLRLVRQLSVPTLALVEGEALGCGAALAACCDVCLATPAARFAWAEPLHTSSLTVAALTPGLPLSLAVLSQTLGRTGWPYLLRQTPLTALEAQRAGLVHAIATDMDAALTVWQASLSAGGAAKTLLAPLRAETFKESDWIERSARWLCAE